MKNKINKGIQGHFGGSWISSLSWLWWCFHVCRHMTKLVTCTLLRCALFFFFFYFRAFCRACGNSQAGVKVELQLQAYATATATQDMSHIWNLQYNSQQHWNLNPLSGARDQTCILMDTSQVFNPMSHHGNSQGVHFYCVSILPQFKKIYMPFFFFNRDNENRIWLSVRSILPI